jgi:hypothetical protein
MHMSRMQSIVRDLHCQDRLCAVAIVGIALSALAGCGQSAPPRVPVYPVQGKVEVNGKPAAGALVLLHPKGDPSRPPARAEVKPDGTFEASTYAPADGAAEGDYIVTVEWFKAVPKNDDFVIGPNLVPDKYSKPQTSKIEVHVAAQPNQLPPITLKR